MFYTMIFICVKTHPSGISAGHCPGDLRAAYFTKADNDFSFSTSREAENR